MTRNEIPGMCKHDVCIRRRCRRPSCAHKQRASAHVPLRMLPPIMLQSCRGYPTPAPPALTTLSCCMRTHDIQHAPAQAGRVTVHAAPTRLLMCAEPYVMGDYGVNECPERSTRITSEEACRRAAAVMGWKWDRRENLSMYPSGCYWGGSNDVEFNAHPVGSGHPSEQLLCAVGTAPSHDHATCRAPYQHASYKQHIPPNPKPCTGLHSAP